MPDGRSLADWRTLAVPTLESGQADVREYMRRMIEPLSPRRRYHTTKAAMRSWFYLGNQWLEPHPQLLAGNGAYHFYQVYKRDSLALFKRPVMNITRVAIRNEIARLGKKEYQPEALASKNEPQWVAAARAAKDILLSEAHRLAWAQKREDLIFNFVVEGMGIVVTSWDELETELSRIAAPDAVTCPGCGLVLASGVVPASFLADGFPAPGGEMRPIAKPETVELPEAAPGMRAQTARLRTCPTCGEELSPYEVSEEEAAGQADSIGNPLGLDVPRGDNAIEIDSVHEFYPENGGLKVEPYTCRVWHRQKVRPLEWIAQRYSKEINPDSLHPEDPMMLLRLDPLFSDPAFLQKPSAYGSTGMEVYNCHARVREVVVAPQKGVPGLELGAHFIQIGESEDIFSRPLCVEVDGENGPELIPKVKFHLARYWKIPGQIWGATFVDDLIPVNRRINEIDAQGMDLRERGKPMLAHPQGVELTVTEESRGALQLLEYDTGENPEWTPKDGLVPAMALTANPYYQERQQCLQDAQMLGAPQDIEMGQPAGSVKTTSGLMLMSDQAAEKRGPMERGLVGLYESVYQHVLDMTKCFRFRSEKATYQVKNESGLFEERSFTAQDLYGARKVVVNMRQGYDQALYQKEAAAEALQMGVIQLDSPLAVDKVLELMRLPKINEEVSVQIRRAEMAWADFMSTKAVPVLDSLFNPGVWFAVLGKHWMEDDCYSLQQAVGFDKVMQQLDGWEELFAQMQARDQAQRAIYGNLPPQQWMPVFQQLESLRQQASLAAPAMGVQAPPPTPPPPGPEGFLPKAMNLAIEACWQRMLGPTFGDAAVAVQTSQTLGLPLEGAAADYTEVQSLLKMRAVIEALRLQVQQAMAPPPVVAPAAAPGQPPGPPATAPTPQ